MFGCSLTQGILQVVGVTSILPFLALAADPQRIRNSQWGSYFLDSLPEMRDNQLLAAAGVFAIVMLFVSNLATLATEYITNRYAQNFGHWLRISLLRRIVSRPYGDFLQANTGMLIKKVAGDVNTYTNGLLLPFLDASARLLTILLLLATLITVHYQVALAVAITLATYYAIVFQLLASRRREITSGLKVASRGALIEVKQTLAGIKPIKIHRAEQHFIERFSNHSAQQANLNGWSAIFGNAPKCILEPFAFSGLVVIVLIYSFRSWDLAEIIPSLAVMALAGYRLLPAAQLFYSQINKLATTTHALDEIYDEFIAAELSCPQEQPLKDSMFSRPTPLIWQRQIELDSITFQYPSTAGPVIEGLDLSIARNTCLGIVGKTGAGKSTLVDILLGLHTPTQGRVVVDGIPLGRHNLRAWRAGIGYVPQEIFLIDDSVMANIAFGIPIEDIDHEALRIAAESAKILDFIEAELPLGFETKVGEHGVRLSGGQRQRIGLARALYHSPSLLILDEATSSLDMATESEVMKAINDLHGSITMIMIAHRRSALDGCDHILDLNRPKHSVHA